jgi:hypothetical protein
MRMSSRDRILLPSGVDVAGAAFCGVAVGAGFGVDAAGLGDEFTTWTAGGCVIWLTASDFSDAETERNSSCILSMVAFISSIRLRIWSSFCWSLLTLAPLFNS